MKVQIFESTDGATLSTTVNAYIAAEDTAGRKVVKKENQTDKINKQLHHTITVWTNEPQTPPA